MFKNYQSDIQLFKRLFTYVLPYKKELLIGLVLTILVAIIASFRPILFKEMINLFVSESHEVNGEIESFIQSIVDFLSPDVPTEDKLIVWTLLTFVLLLRIDLLKKTEKLVLQKQKV